MWGVVLSAEEDDKEHKHKSHLCRVAERNFHKEEHERGDNVAQHQHHQRSYDCFHFAVLIDFLQAGGRKFEQIDDHLCQIIVEEVLDVFTPINLCHNFIVLKVINITNFEYNAFFFPKKYIIANIQNKKITCKFFFIFSKAQ